MRYDTFGAFHTQPLEVKLPSFYRDGQLSDLIYTKQLSRALCEDLFKRADRIKTLSQDKEGRDFLQTLLSDRRAMLFFAQPSTRTFLSFQNACHLLGMKTSEIRDTSTSSEAKGESSEDSIQTFASYVDLMILRHIEKDFSEKAAWVLGHAGYGVPVINGGAGKDEHPTQALLDLYTLYQAFKDHGGIEGKTIVMVGDLLRGRTVRSLTQLLMPYSKVRFIFVAPEGLQMQEDLCGQLDYASIGYQCTDEFASVLPEADIVYMTRLQDEHDRSGESRAIPYENFMLKHEHLKLLNPHAAILHPLPRRGEIEVSIDRDPRAWYWRQTENGMWVRAALIATLMKQAHRLV